MRSAPDDHPARQPAPTYGTRRPVSLVVTCAQCRQEVLKADRIGDEEECLLRDHLLVVHPNTIQPETRAVLLRHFVLTEEPAPPEFASYPSATRLQATTIRAPATQYSTAVRPACLPFRAIILIMKSLRLRTAGLQR